jgi:NADPH:quinone reductase-like Zn-dependent oxidoreductase
MHTAIVTKWGETPKYVEVETPPVPSADSGFVQIKLVASGLHQIVKSRAEGTHYSAKTLPHVPGIDGVATTEDGKHVYFSTLATGGSMSEVINIPKKDTTPFPEGLDPVQAAALLNPAMSSWMAMRTRTIDLPKNFTVLIMGATTMSGTIAIPLVRSLGAAKVIGVARNVAALEALGLDETIQLMDPVEKTDFSKLGDVDVNLDYLWGPPTVHLFNQLASKVPVQFIQVGSMAGLEANLVSANLRSKNITMRGAGPGAWTFPQLIGEYGNILNALKSVKKQEVRVVKLADIEKVWNEKSTVRMVFVP